MSSNRPNPPLAHRTPEERVAIGRAARAGVRRSAHAAWQEPTDRADPFELLRTQEETRVPELVPVRPQRIDGSPVTF
jgi:hypothetical protein